MRRKRSDWPEYFRLGALLEYIYSGDLVWLSGYDETMKCWVGMDAKGRTCHVDNPHAVRVPREQPIKQVTQTDTPLGGLFNNEETEDNDTPQQ